jgi:hypothetical protein
MGFNIGSALGGFVQGTLLSGGNMLVGGIDGLTSGISGAGGVAGTGNLGNSGLSAFQSGYLNEEEAMNEQNMMFQLAVQGQSQQFDQMTQERSELLREQNELRDVSMAQKKADDGITKDFANPAPS